MLHGRAALTLKVAAILAPALIIYWQDLQIVATDALNSEVMNYILVIPVFITFALYRKRRMLQAATPLENEKEIRLRQEMAGLSLCLSALILCWHGSSTFYPVEYHLLSMPIFLAGAILLVYNWQTLRQLLFPLALLLFLQPIPIQAANIIGFEMSAFASTAAYNLVKLFGLPATLSIEQTPVIVTQTVQGDQLPLVVDAASSGLYSLTGFVVFAVFAAFITRGPLWKRATIFSAGLPMIYGLNILRIAAIVWIGHGWGGAEATRASHILEGSFLIFIAILVVLVVGVRLGRLRVFASRVGEEPCEFCGESMNKGENFCPYCGKILKPQGQEVTSRKTLEIASVVAVTLLTVLTKMHPFALAMGTTETGRSAGLMFVLAAGPCILVIASLYLKRWIDRTRKAELYRHLELPREIVALEVLALTSKEGLATGRAIEAKYREVTDEAVEPEALLEILKEAAETGIVKKHIGSREDEPVLLWKLNF